jgi:hypothetical protein
MSQEQYVSQQMPSANVIKSGDCSPFSLLPKSKIIHLYPIPDDDFSQVLDEHAVAERHGLLGGKSLINSNGKLEKLKYLLTCDFSGSYPLDFCDMQILQR